MGDPRAATEAGSARRAERALIELHRQLGASSVLTHEEAREALRTDDSGLDGPLPCGVVLAQDPTVVAKTLAICQRFELPVTPRAAGTSRVGGAVAVAGGLVLVTTGMNAIKELDPVERIAVVEPGVVLGELHRAAEAAGLFYPPDPNSQATCTIGGNAATNAGGPRALKYGVTRDYVLGLSACLIGGDAIFAGRRTTKGVTGYDMAGLLVGSEGTLAVTTELTLRLVPRPEQVRTLLALFSEPRAIANATEAVLATGLTPRCIEFLDALTLAAVRRAGNAIDERAAAMLVVEVDGDTVTVDREMERIGAALDAAGAFEVLVAQDEAQRARLWAARREMSHAVRRLARAKVSEDVAVPRRQLGALLEAAEASAERHQVRSLAYGHAGDGNLHFNFLYDDDDEKRRVDQAVEELFRITVRLGGTLSGEHGIGLTKAPYLPIEQSAALIALQQRLKGTFDPGWLLNPGKIFSRPGHHGAC